MLLALVLAQALSPIGNPEGPIFSQPSLMNRYAFFEFAPASGAGMPSSACDCSTDYAATTGTNPYFVAASSTHAWTANFSSNTVTKLHVADAGIVGQYATGAGPHNVLLAGDDVWVSNYTASTLTRLTASTGALVATYDAGVNVAPIAATYDGTDIWVACWGDNTVKRFNATTGAFVSSSSVGAGPTAVHYDGTNIWTANYTDGTATKLLAADGGFVGNSTVGTHPYGVTSDGTHAYVANLDSDTVSKLVIADGGLAASFVSTGGPHAIDYDGAYLLVANFTAANLLKMQRTDGTVLETYPVGAGAHGVAHDGTNYWTANYTDSTATRIYPGSRPTDARGGAETFTAASRRYCFKGSESSFATGDGVRCSSGWARVQPGGDGTGALGQGAWASRVNLVAGNNDLNGADWTTGGAEVVAPTVTANAGADPLGLPGALTVEQVDFPAVAGGSTKYTLVYNVNLITASAAAYSGGFLVRSTGATSSGTIYLSLTPDAVTYKTVACAHTSGAWSYCKLENQTLTAVGYRFFIGIDRRDANQRTDQAAQSVLISRPMLHLGSTLAPPIDTAIGGNATSAAEVGSFSTTLSGSTLSAAATWVHGSGYTANATAFQIYVDANNDVKAYEDATGHLVCDFRIGGSSNTVTTTATLTVSASNRVACYYDGASRAACIGGVCDTTAGALTLPTGAASFYVGSRSAAGNEARGTLSQGCSDPNNARCI